MVLEIKVPNIGIDEVEVTEILVSVGDKVEAEQSLITVEGDKASMEVPAPFAGTVKEINIKVGDKITNGSLIMLFETISGEQNSNAAPAASPQQSTNDQSRSRKEVKVPDIGDEEVEVIEIMVQVGDKVSAEQSLITVEGNKASMEVPAPFAGTVKEINIKVGDKITNGSLIMIFEVEDDQPAAIGTKNTMVNSQQTTEVFTWGVSSANKNVPVQANKNKKEEFAEKEAFAENDAYFHATPVIRRLARKFGVNLTNIKGTGRKGRILCEDIQAYVKEAVKNAESLSESTASGSFFSSFSRRLVWPKINFGQFGNIEEIELSRIKKISGSNLHRNWVMIPHVTQFDEADITEMEEFRKQQNAEAEKKKLDVKITPLVFIMKAVAKALEELPRFNSSLSADSQKLTLKKYINIGVAVETPNSLVVPVFRNVNKKGIMELSRELMELSKKARAGKLILSDMQGGCFSISSLGGIGGTSFTPIVNAPEVAILGVSKSSIKPVWDGKEFAPRLILPLSLSYDHRVIDGADGVRFISFINHVMSDVRHLLM
ncbi:pyruvate dehydrogenase complex dihydrolipoyllysine-residue acetyltransferase [Candidatus Hoaglandella endobia]|uniref:Acetyltransferase component of pyruvate dehydrogenase complex n=1 Tax=Candidatus Hoaglandella endobia TaxID=1778263 RepID=A0A143WTU9_9ENTR|nr:pyruvate dehydrogenase complex dihydrolipoyllysine-residue acetyltransferase [Candidatus Hoaglandella endobia]CUX97281.1 Dihydrolipoyllysine-residue acetyltransferase component of pyruvate dehydrogenase complex [Candidatus Hoaglandella endobia]